MANIPKSFQDYDDDDTNIEKRKYRYEYWSALKVIREEFMSSLPKDTGFDAYDFDEYLNDKYGIKLNFFGDRMITDEFIITDEKKYLIFVLKFR